MKEQWIPRRYMSEQLTRKPENRYSGSTPMPGIDQVDAMELKPQVRTQPIRPSRGGERGIPKPVRSDMSRFTGNITTITNPDARQFASEVRAPERGDLGQWDTEAIKDQYAKLNQVRGSVQLDRESSAQLLPYGEALMRELHKRGEDKWILEQASASSELPVRRPVAEPMQMRVEGGDLKTIARGLGSERITDSSVRRALGGVLSHPSPNKEYLQNRLRDVMAIEPGYKPREYKEDGSENPQYKQQMAEYDDMQRQQQHAARVLEQMIDVAPEGPKVDRVSRVLGGRRRYEGEGGPSAEQLRLEEAVHRAAEKARERGATPEAREKIAAEALDILEKDAFEPWASRLTDGDYGTRVQIVFDQLNDVEIGYKYDENGNTIGSKNPELEYLMNIGMEYLLERFNSKGDIDPFGATPSHNYIEEQNIDTIMQLARQFGETRGDPDQKLYNYLYNLRGKRATIHDIFKNMKSRRAYVEGITQGLSKRGLRFIEEEIVGVADGERWFERVLADKTAHKKKWINEDDFTDARKQVQTLINGDPNLKMDLNKLVTGERREEFKVGLRKWQKDRAALVSWMMGDVSQRNLTYICMGDMPGPGDPDRWHSVRAEELVRLLGEIKFMAQRFLIQAPCQAMVNETVKIRMKDNIYGLHTGHGEEAYGKGRGDQGKGLYGKDTKSHAVLDDHIQDIKSASGWRMKDLFLRSSVYSTAIYHGKAMSFADFMDMEEEHAHHAAVDKRPKEFQGDKKNDSIQKDRYIHNIEHAEADKELNRRIRHEIKDQRLYLGVILQAYSGKLDTQNKIEIWKNAVELLPSRMAAFLPEDTLKVVAQQYGLGDIGKIDGHGELSASQKAAREKTLKAWGQLKTKLWVVEEARIREDAEIYKQYASAQKKYKEDMDKYEKGELKDAEGKLKPKPVEPPKAVNPNSKLDKYMDESWTDADKEALKGLIEVGRKNIATDNNGNSVLDSLTADKDGNIDTSSVAGGLSKIRFMYTPWLDDVPVTEYGRLQDNDLERLVVGDHSDADEAWKKIMFGIYANPAITGEKFASTIVDAFHKFTGPLGVAESQLTTKYPVEAWMNMAAQNGGAYLGGAFMKFLRLPQSQIERYNLQANINLDPDEQKSLYVYLAQHEVINDDPGEANQKGNGINTRYYTEMQERIKKRKLLLKSAANAAWIITNLFGIGVAIEFLKVASPEFSKSFGLK